MQDQKSGLDHKAWYVAAFRRDVSNDSMFRDLRDTFFRDPELTSTDQKEILAAVTGAAQRRLSSHRGRLQELEAWRTRELDDVELYERAVMAGSG